ncbi:DUF3466 family protein [Salinimonas marina]|uniref:DUF3466 family protein n=1 Tax=Salinimonas marina TaxID=2785918 RepID=A0A7S9HEB3_9ALTE|nr:DUF3466 family protein [Salinimonas marina]QPG07055.1 DUF3466 family protein [Salinimonas marina]
MKRTQLAAAIVLATSSITAWAENYTVTPLPVSDKAQNSFAKSIDNTGAMLTTVSGEFSPFINTQWLADRGYFEDNSEVLEDADAAAAGNFTTADYERIVNSLLASSDRSATGFQHLARFRSYLTDTVESSLIPGLDVLRDDESQGFTQSVQTIARDSLSADYIVGTSQLPYLRVDYVDEDGEDNFYVLSEGPIQAFAQINGQSIRLPSPDDTLNGYATAYAINENFQVAGYSTTGFLDSRLEDIAQCMDDETRGEQIIEKCLQEVLYVSGRTSTGFPLRDASQIRPTIWQLDASGNIVSTTTFPMLFEPDENQLNANYAGYAQAINNNGVAVGRTVTSERETVAVSFVDGQTIEMLPRDENQVSSAVAINDENWVTGYVQRAPNGVSRKRLFVHNLDSGEDFYPQGFYNNAPTEGRAINNNNIVVGVSESEPARNTTAAQHRAFMYTVGDEEIVDLNTLISCDSEYTLVDAIDINDNNEIIANALFKKPLRNIDGTIVVDDNGEQVSEEVIQAVKLTPNGNTEPRSCDGDEDTDEDFERSGAGVNWLFLGMMGGLIGWRRWFQR